jgi:hypothetical protein
MREEQLTSKFLPQKFNLKNGPANVVKVIRGGSNCKNKLLCDYL